MKFLSYKFCAKNRLTGSSKALSRSRLVRCLKGDIVLGVRKVLKPNIIEDLTKLILIKLLFSLEQTYP